MRSRYAAYTLADIGYIERTLAPEHRAGFDAEAARRWATEADWRGLRIVATDKGRAEDDDGVVEFVATYKQNGQTIAHHEVSRFRRGEDGEWLFVEGSAGNSREAPKIGRNDPCPCGSGKKYKKCCGAAR